MSWEIPSTLGTEAVTGLITGLVVSRVYGYRSWRRHTPDTAPARDMATAENDWSALIDEIRRARDSIVQLEPLLERLERLAQNDPDHRQPFLKEVCHQLWIGARHGAAWQSTLTGLLTRHLRPGGGEPNPEFWPDMDIEFSPCSRVLIDFDFSGCRVRRACFQDTTFIGDATFDNTGFADIAEFDRSHFARHASFRGVTFAERAIFHQAKFCGNVYFPAATVGGQAMFRHARFSGRTDFRKAAFAQDASFNGARFAGRALFQDALFTTEARFDQARFHGRADFTGASFGDIGCFTGARFARRVHFDQATFAHSEFREARVRTDVTTATRVWPDGWRMHSPASKARGRLLDDRGVWGELRITRPAVTKP